MLCTPAVCAAGQTIPGSNTDSMQSVPFKASSTKVGGARFEELSVRVTNVDLEHAFPNEPKWHHLLSDYNSAGGIAIGDFDQNGRPDLFFTNYNRGNKLYRNLGNWKFEDVTAPAGLDAIGLWSTGPTFVDIDNDGDLDLYVCVTASPNLLYINDGKGHFSEQARAFGLDYSGASVMMSFADYDRDGLLDAYLLTNRLTLGTDHRKPKSSEETFARKIVVGHADGTVTISPEYKSLFRILYAGDAQGKQRSFLVNAGQEDILYHNNGDGTFSDVSSQAGIHGFDIGNSATWWDYNDDALPDLYVANDFEGLDYLYKNNGDGTFTDVAVDVLPHVPWFSMGADYADINNDGHMDLFATDMAATTHYKQKLNMGDMGKRIDFVEAMETKQYMRNALFLNTGTGRMLEGAKLAGVVSTDWTWSVKFADFDNDGFEDLFVPNGMSGDFMNSDLQARQNEKPEGAPDVWDGSAALLEMNRAYHNLGDLTFEDASTAWGLDKFSASYGSATGDLDGDGDLDLVLTNFNAPVSLYRNNSAQGNSIQFQLCGTTSNAQGLGAALRVTTSEGKMQRFHNTVRGFMSSNENIVHFGLGDAENVDTLDIVWPNGDTQHFENLASNHRYTITEGRTGVQGQTKEQGVQLFNRVNVVANYSHEEDFFNDFDRQPLLPNKLSTLGPGMAVGDVNGDGVDDLYTSGSTGHLGALLLGRKNGTYSKTQFLTIGANAKSKTDIIKRSEEMGVVFLDSDSDGDLDLYVASGGVECEPGDPVLQDRLYVNNGSGLFEPMPSLLPEIRESSGVVTAADFDRDGDVDLYVGSRSIPGRYPLTPRSHLLVNEGGTFHVADKSRAEGLESSGLVTSALWSDVDDDGWLDLLVTHEWGPVSVFRNKQGALSDATADAGTAHLSGWWNGITGRDIDGDGDIDYVITNFGLNTKYHASQDLPAEIYYDDFGKEGEFRIVEACFEEGKHFPVRGKGCSTKAIPALAPDFPTFEKFALASLADIYTSEKLEQAHRVEASVLETGVLLNDGTGHFTFSPLPGLSQIAPAFGAVLTEVNGDGYPDAYLVQNFFGPQVETGRMDGGLSLLLKGGPGASFEPMWPEESGLIVPGDAMSLVAMDFNQDNLPDFVTGLNSGPMRAFTHTGQQGHTIAKVRLVGPKGNPHAYGARVTFQPAGGVIQTAEVYGGAGYLSQSGPVLFFGLSNKSTAEVNVHWPDGTATNNIPMDAGRRSLVVTHL
jgi:hypothetical protein